MQNNIKENILTDVKDNIGVDGIIISVMFAFWFIILHIFRIILVMAIEQKIVRSKLLPKLSEKIRTITGISELSCHLVKSKEINAWMESERPELYITSALYELLDEREITAIMLHEAGHYANKQKRLIHVTAHISILSLSISLFLFSLFRINDKPLKAAGATAGWMLLVKIQELLDIAEIKYGKFHEYMADSYATTLGYGSEIKSALLKIYKESSDELCKDLKNQTNGRETCKNAFVAMHQDDVHPYVVERAISIDLNIKEEDLFYTRKLLKSEYEFPKSVIIRKSIIELFFVYRKVKAEITKKMKDKKYVKDVEDKLYVGFKDDKK